MPRKRELSLLDIAIAGVLTLFALVLVARATALLIITPPISWAFVAAFGVAVALTASLRIELGRRSGMPIAGLTVTLLVIMAPEADPFRLLGVWTAASLVTQFLGAGGMGSRIDAQLTLDGDDAFVDYGGALLTREQQRQECAVAIRHAALNGSSRQTWRAVAADRSQASLAARVEVARGAQKTDGEQSLRGLLLQRTATVNLKPELEIFADDVKCAHGATVGELDANQLFYAMNRGLDPASATALLLEGFVTGLWDGIADAAKRDEIASLARDALRSVAQ